MSATTNLWNIKCQRVHGRLAILFWREPPHLRTPAKAHFKLPEGDVDITTHKNNTAAIKLTMHNGEAKAYWTQTFSHKDWQGIIEGYYEPTGDLSDTTAIWCGATRIQRNREPEALWLRHCCSLRALLGHLRWEKHRFQNFLPIGKFWGLIGINEYLKRAVQNNQTPPYGCTLNNGEDFGYLVVQSPKTTFLKMIKRKSKP